MKNAERNLSRIPNANNTFLGFSWIRRRPRGQRSGNGSQIRISFSEMRIMIQKAFPTEADELECRMFKRECRIIRFFQITTTVFQIGEIHVDEGRSVYQNF